MKNRYQYIKSNKRVVLSIWQTVEHYSFMLVPLMFPAIELFHKFGGKSAVNKFSALTQFIFISISLIIGYFKWRELSFYKIDVSRSDEEFENAVLASANKLNWRINILDKSKSEAIVYNPWKSGGEQTIKIERQENRALINSMFEPELFSFPDFFGVNKKNIYTFLHYYYQSAKVENLNEKVIQNLKEEEKKIENEPEWSLKNTIKRIIAYIICFGFLAIGIAIWKYERFNLTVVLLEIIGSSYIILDIYVMWTKRKNAST